MDTETTLKYAILPSAYLLTNYAEEKYTEKHVELIVAQDASTQTAHFITKQEINLLSH
jgi:hypothetical protein